MTEIDEKVENIRLRELIRALQSVCCGAALTQTTRTRLCGNMEKDRHNRNGTS